MITKTKENHRTKPIHHILLTIHLAGTSLLSAAEPASSSVSSPSSSASSPAAKLRRPISPANPLFLIGIYPGHLENPQRIGSPDGESPGNQYADLLGSSETLKWRHQ